MTNGVSRMAGAIRRHVQRRLLTPHATTRRRVSGGLDPSTVARQSLLTGSWPRAGDGCSRSLATVLWDRNVGCGRQNTRRRNGVQRAGVPGMLAEPGATIARVALVIVSVGAVAWSLGVAAMQGPRRGPRFMTDLPKPPARSHLTDIVFRNPGSVRTNADWPHQMRARFAEPGAISAAQPVPQAALWQLAPPVPAEWAR